MVESLILHARTFLENHSFDWSECVEEQSIRFLVKNKNP